jgi:hypothetical protein
VPKHDPAGRLPALYQNELPAKSHLAVVGNDIESAYYMRFFPVHRQITSQPVEISRKNKPGPSHVHGVPMWPSNLTYSMEEAVHVHPGAAASTAYMDSATCMEIF